MRASPRLRAVYTLCCGVSMRRRKPGSVRLLLLLLGVVRTHSDSNTESSRQLSESSEELTCAKYLFREKHGYDVGMNGETVAVFKGGTLDSCCHECFLNAACRGVVLYAHENTCHLRDGDRIMYTEGGGTAVATKFANDAAEVIASPPPPASAHYLFLGDASTFCGAVSSVYDPLGNLASSDWTVTTWLQYDATLIDATTFGHGSYLFGFGGRPFDMDRYGVFAPAQADEFTSAFGLNVASIKRAARPKLTWTTQPPL